MSAQPFIRLLRRRASPTVATPGVATTVTSTSPVATVNADMDSGERPDLWTSSSPALTPQIVNRGEALVPAGTETHGVTIGGGIDGGPDTELRTRALRQGRPTIDLDADLLLEQHRRGLTYGELAELHGVSSRTIMNRLRALPEFRPHARGSRPDPARRQRSLEMLELYRSGMTLSQIGVQYDLSMERIRQLLVADTGYRSRQRSD